MSASPDLDAAALSSAALTSDDEPTGWTPARVAALERLWKAGLSAGQIAGRLGGGATRSAVMGKLRRLQLLGRRTAASAPRGAQVPAVEALAPALPSRRPRIPFAPPSEPAPAVETTDIPPNARVLAQLSPVCCRWPVGPTPPEGHGHRQLFCGEVARGGRSYCAEHARRAWKTDPARGAAPNPPLAGRRRRARPRSSSRAGTSDEAFAERPLSQLR